MLARDICICYHPIPSADKVINQVQYFPPSVELGTSTEGEQSLHPTYSTLEGRGERPNLETAKIQCSTLLLESTVSSPPFTKMGASDQGTTTGPDHASSSITTSDLKHDQRLEQSSLDRTSTRHSIHSFTRGNGELELAKTRSIAETLSPIREFLFVGLLCCAQIVTQAGLVNTLNILHIIGDDLGMHDPGVLSWCIAGYSLTVGTFILLSGRFGDLFGFKPMIVIGFSWYAITNVAAGCSVYVDGSGGQVLFIFARVLGGIGPAILLPNALGLLGATYDEGRRKDMIFSLFGSCAPGMLDRCWMIK